MGDYEDAFTAAVATELRAQRGRTRITYDALAEQTGLAKTTVLNYLNGKRDIPLSAFFALCRALRTDPLTIFSFAQESVED